MDLNALLRGIRKRHSSNPIDKICAIAFPFIKYHYATDSYMTLPIYDSNTPNSVAWEELISSLASTRVGFYELFYLDDIYGWDSASRLPYTATTQLLYLFPHPSKHHWFPSWSQVQQYPDVSVRDSNPSETASGMDFSLRIMSGRIYRGCSLRLIKPPTSETKAIYCSTLDGKDAQLVATVPGIELHIDSRSKYILVDISHTDDMCINNDKGHEHLPIWPKSVIIVCEEVDTLAPEYLSAVMEYRLRRVTTLEWEADGYWLPFEPSLVHMRSIVCSAKGRNFLKSLKKSHKNSSDTDEDPDMHQDLDMHQFQDMYQDLVRYQDLDMDQDLDNDQDLDMGEDPATDTDQESDMDQDLDLDVFCDPVVVARLLSQEGWHEDWPQGWHSRWPRYEVYLV